MNSKGREWIGVIALLLVLRLPVVIDGWIGADKIKHFVVSVVLQSFTYSAAQAAGAERGDAMRISVATTAAAGVAREIYDGRVKGRFSVSDLIWDGAGIAAASAMLRHSR
jgi:uncharacterized protein YfiM (DUF2279 family)